MEENNLPLQKKSKGNYRILIITLLLAVLMSSVLPVYNAMVSYPAMVRFMQQGVEQGALNAARHIVTEFSGFNSETFTEQLSSAHEKSLRAFASQYGMIRARVYSPAGRIIFSTRQEDLGTVNQNRYFRDVVGHGHPLTKLVNKKQRSMEGDELSIDVAEVYVPVMLDGSFCGAFEFYFDVTGQKKQIDAVSASSLRVFLLTNLGFLTLFIVVAFRMRQAIQKQQAAEQEIILMAYTDTLTGLPNRRLLTDRIDQALKRAKRHKLMLTLLYIDVDNFKTINDTLGHQQGDELLQYIAEQIRQHIRKSDTLARIGGDEFVLLASDLSSAEEAKVVAQTISRIFETPYLARTGPVSVSLSIGVAVFPKHGQDSETLLKNADAAMYEAKSTGRNTYVVYRPAEAAAKRAKRGGPS